MHRMYLPLASATLVAVSFAPMQAASDPAAQARKTLRDMERSTAAVVDRADELNLYSRDMRYSPDADLSGWIAIKEDVNRVGRELASLQAERGSLAPWEQQAIDRTTPLMKQAAENADKAIRFFDQNRDHLWTKTYANYTGNLYQETKQADKTLREYLDLAKARNREEHLGHSLAVQPGL